MYIKFSKAHALKVIQTLIKFKTLVNKYTYSYVALLFVYGLEPSFLYYFKS